MILFFHFNIFNITENLQFFIENIQLSQQHKRNPVGHGSLKVVNIDFTVFGSCAIGFDGEELTSHLHIITRCWKKMYRYILP